MTSPEFYHNKTILVTGGVGSIGSQLVRNLLRFDPASIRVFDNNETGLFDLEQDLHSPSIRILIGDVRDKNRVDMAMDGVDIVFHASALKHVPLCEYNPFEAVKTNVLGTQNVLEAALRNQVEKVINISTDKAVNPANVMGATKLLAERLAISANYYKGDKRTVISSVRFGNVLNSRGSVIPLFKNQIREGKCVTVTDTEMNRFFMDIPSAVNLILTAGRISRGGEIFILKMPAIRILDLAEVMIEHYAPVFGFKPDEIPLKIIGKRNGEKLYEDLLTEEEIERVYENEDMFVIVSRSSAAENPDDLISPSGDPFDLVVPPGFRRAKRQQYSSKNVPLVDRDRIRDLLKDF